MASFKKGNKSMMSKFTQARIKADILETVWTNNKYNVEYLVSEKEGYIEQLEGDPDNETVKRWLEEVEYKLSVYDDIKKTLEKML